MAYLPCMAHVSLALAQHLPRMQVRGRRQESGHVYASLKCKRNWGTLVTLAFVIFFARGLCLHYKESYAERFYPYVGGAKFLKCTSPVVIILGF